MTMMFGMIMVGCNFKIFNPVIGSNLIYVMNNLKRLQFTPKIIFHHFAMLKHALTIKANIFITIFFAIRPTTSRSFYSMQPSIIFKSFIMAMAQTFCPMFANASTNRTWLKYMTPIFKTPSSPQTHIMHSTIPFFGNFFDTIINLAIHLVKVTFCVTKINKKIRWELYIWEGVPAKKLSA